MQIVFFFFSFTIQPSETKPCHSVALSEELAVKSIAITGRNKQTNFLYLYGDLIVNENLIPVRC